MYLKTDGGLGQAAVPYGSIAGVLGDALLRPPVDSSAVVGCVTRGRPFDDFKFNSAVVPAQHGPRIKELAQIIAKSWITDPNNAIRTVCLEGHTDNVGSVERNKDLGLERAKNLRKALKQAIFAGFGYQRAATTKSGTLARVAYTTMLPGKRTPHVFSVTL